MFKRFFDDKALYGYKFRSDIFPCIEDREFWENFNNESCISEAEKEIDYPWPPIKATDFMEYKKSGNRTIMEGNHFQRRNHLVLFALAELKENKGRFLPQIVNGLFTICEESYWGVSAHWLRAGHEVGNIPSPKYPYIDLFAAETAEHVSMVITLLREPLLNFCPEIIERVEYELDRRIKAPYESRLDAWWMGYGEKSLNNWTPWIISNVLSVFLLCEPNEYRKQRAIRKMMIETQKYYDTLPSDGGCDEGPGYWARAGASLFEIIYLLKIATDGKMDLFDDEKLRLIASYMKKVHITQDIFVNVADAHATGIGYILPLLYGVAKQTKQEDLINFSVAAYRERTNMTDPLKHVYRTMRRLILNSQFIKEMDSYEVKYPLHNTLELLPKLQLAVLRSKDMSLSAKGGFNNESHNHNDVGSFAFYDGKTPVLVDIGISTYTKFTFTAATRYTMIPWTRSAYHNLPLINDVEQRFGAEYKADSFEADQTGIRISFASAYPKQAGVKTLRRTVCFENGLPVIKDSFEFGDEGARVKEILMSVLPTRIENNTVIIADRYRVSASVGIFDTERVDFDDKNLPRDWGVDHCTRIMLDVDGEKEICIRVEKI